MILSWRTGELLTGNTSRNLMTNAVSQEDYQPQHMQGGKALLEWMHICLPAIAYNVPGVAEVAKRSEAIWTKRSEVGNPVLGDRIAWRMIEV